MDNRTLLQKADLVLADLQTDGGYLQEEQAKRFYEIALEEAMFLPMMQVKAMKSHTWEGPKAAFYDRILHPGQSATPLTLGQRSKVTTDNLSLTASLFRGEVRIDDETLEDNIEGEAFRNTIMRMIAKQIGADMEDNVLNGDTASVTSYLTPFDGLRKKQTSWSVAAGGPLTDDVLKDLLRILPSEFIRRKSEFMYFTSSKAEIDYRHDLGARMTAHGDSHLGSVRRQEPSSVFYAGIPVMALDLMPENLGGGNETEVMFCNPKNAILGIYRQVRIETDRDKGAGTNIFYVTTRFTTEWEHEPMTAKATGVTI